jgi:hypothetical protein
MVPMKARSQWTEKKDGRNACDAEPGVVCQQSRVNGGWHAPPHHRGRVASAAAPVWASPAFPPKTSVNLRREHLLQYAWDGSVV